MRRRVSLRWLGRGVHRRRCEGSFESPSGSTSHAERACDAALWLREAIAAFAQRIERERGIEVEVRIGINSGEVLAGTIGDHHTRFYTTGGYPVALAKRVEGAANRVRSTFRSTPPRFWAGD